MPPPKDNLPQNPVMIMPDFIEKLPSETRDDLMFHVLLTYDGSRSTEWRYDPMSARLIELFLTSSDRHNILGRSLSLRGLIDYYFWVLTDKIQTSKSQEINKSIAAENLHMKERIETLNMSLARRRTQIAANREAWNTLKTYYLSNEELRAFHLHSILSQPPY